MIAEGVPRFTKALDEVLGAVVRSKCRGKGDSFFSTLKRNQVLPKGFLQGNNVTTLSVGPAELLQ